MLGEQLATAKLPADQLSKVLSTAPSLNVLSAVRPADNRQGLANQAQVAPVTIDIIGSAVLKSLHVAASIKTFEVGHGGLLSLAEGSLKADKDNGGRVRSAAPGEIAKGLFCRIFIGDPPCGPRPPASGVAGDPLTLTDEQLASIVGSPIGQGAPKLFNRRDDHDAPSPAGYTFLGQIIDHDLTDTLVALADPGVAAIGSEYLAESQPAPANVPADAAPVRPSNTIRIGTVDVPLSVLVAALKSVPGGKAAIIEFSGNSSKLDLEEIYRVKDYADLADNAALSPWFEVDSSQNPTGYFNLKPVRVPGHKLTGYDFFRKDDPVAPHGQIAEIGDGRNDENRMIAGIQSLFELMHNECMTSLKADAPAQSLPDRFNECQRDTRMVFQTIVVTDFLPRILDTATLKDISGVVNADVDHMKVPEPGKVHRRLYMCTKGADELSSVKMPLEFAVAGFRIGHSLLRNNYVLHTGSKKLLFSPNDNSIRKDLLGGSPLKPDTVIDWSYFFDLPLANSNRPQHANRIDTRIAIAVGHLPTAALPKVPKLDASGKVVVGADGTPVMVTDTASELNLPRRNVLRSEKGDDQHGAAGIVNGEDAETLAERLAPGIRPVDQAHLGRVIPAGLKSPLWLYVLAEAEQYENSMSLGPLGSRIVGEVVLGVVDCDAQSVINALQPSSWPPMQQIRSTGRYSMPDLLLYLQSKGKHLVASF